jgi:hypothetical protein
MLATQADLLHCHSATKRMMTKYLPITLGVMLFSGISLAGDTRQLVTLPEPAREVLRQEMLDNLMAVNEVLTLLAEGKVKEAGQSAETRLGVSAMGKNRALPPEARPGAQMPPAMHEIGVAGHRAATAFAEAAATGDRDKALARLPELTGNCVACHFSYRVR